ncbi:tripartite motif-containing protein 59 [Paramormyrops kingsleyae]|uniref:Tripartite motif containing 59 n=1 Tax=Paramormyrops kingsleyae TaxID=1676925 RepID=A0A3B3SB44_9TELE|nr:tripartite motif-containing protein 59 [Paramormyrops kingsleyae]XP_023662982.1 tripartite motif-containing protein 59 [Paramormyrops kingsleyae]
MDSLEEDLTCSVCCSLFSDPRLLPCSHTFCKACLEKVLQVSVNFSIWRPLRIPLKCPNCRSVVELPPLGVDGLPVNISLRAIVEKFQCDGHPRPAACPEHPRQPLNVYCVRDRKLVCGFCLTVGQHQGHPIDDLDTAYVKEREAPAHLIEQLTDKRWAEVCALVDQLEQDKERCERLLQQDRGAVVQFFGSLELILAQKKEAFMEALEAASGELQHAYDPLIEKLKDMKEEQLDLISYSTAVEGEESPLAFLEKVHIFRERVEALIRAPLPRPTVLSTHPRAAEFLEQHWAGVTVADLEQGPIPQITCCVQGCGQKEGPPSTWPQLAPPVPSTVLLVLLLSIVLFGLSYMYAPPVSFPDLPRASQVLQAVLHELTGHVCLLQETMVYLQSMVGDVILKCRFLLSSLGETTGYYLGTIFKLF